MSHCELHAREDCNHHICNYLSLSHCSLYHLEIRALARSLLILAVLVFLYPHPVIAEWQKITGPWDPICDSSFNALAFHPANPQIIYIGSSRTSQGCGIFKTMDGGQTWSESNTGLPKVRIPFRKPYIPPITKIAISPSNPSILYVGAGDGIYKSTNEGESWIRVTPRRFFGISVISAQALDITIHPQNPDIVLIGLVENGVYRTTDGGRSWKKVQKGSSPPPHVSYHHIVRFAPAEPTILYSSSFTHYSGPIPLCAWRGDLAGECVEITGVSPQGLEKSTDTGTKWQRITFSGTFPTDIVIHPSDSNVIYISTMGVANLFAIILLCIPGEGILKSIDGGQSWSPVNNGIPQKSLSSAFPLTCQFREERIPIIALSIDLTNPDKLYAAGIDGIFYSLDGGNNWLQFTQAGLPSPLLVSKIFVSPDGQRIYAATSRGLYWSNTSLDSQPPDIIDDFQASDWEDSQSTLTWTNPSDNDLAEVLVRRKADGYPADHTDGDLVYQDTSPTPGAEITHVDVGLANDTTYYYAVFSRDQTGNWNDQVVEGKNTDTGTPRLVALQIVIVEHDDPNNDVFYPKEQAHEVIEAEDPRVIRGGITYRGGPDSPYIDPSGPVLWLFDSTDGISFAEVQSSVPATAVFIQFGWSDSNDGIARILVDGQEVYRINTLNRGAWYLEISTLPPAQHTVRVETIVGEGQGDIHLDFFAFW